MTPMHARLHFSSLNITHIDVGRQILTWEERNVAFKWPFLALIEQTGLHFWPLSTFPNIQDYFNGFAIALKRFQIEGLI